MKPKTILPLILMMLLGGQAVAQTNWTLQDINGQSHSLSDYSGNIIVLGFFVSW